MLSSRVKDTRYRAIDTRNSLLYFGNCLYSSHMELELNELSAAVGTRLMASNMMLATAESCTGGLIAVAVTDISGSSKWFDRGFVTYTNQSKQDMLGVKPETLTTHGAVSEQVVGEMAQGALQHSQAHISLAVSGIAGPFGGTEEKPVGTVCLAWAQKNTPVHTDTRFFQGDRQQIRQQATAAALQGVLELIA